LKSLTKRKLLAQLLDWNDNNKNNILTIIQNAILKAWMIINTLQHAYPHTALNKRNAMIVGTEVRNGQNHTK
jgi:hypothetical protein